MLDTVSHETRSSNGVRVSEPASEHGRRSKRAGDDDGADFPDRRQVTSPAAIELLTNLKALRHLLPFTAQAHTLTSAAVALGRPVTTVAYWLPQFLDAGLLEHLGDERRAGKAMPRYRAIAREIAVPFAAIPFDRRVALLDGGRTRLLRRFLDGIDEAMAGSDTFSLGFSGRADGSMAIAMIEERELVERPYTDGWWSLHLDETSAVALARELEALMEKYGTEDGPGTKRYVTHIGLAPDPRFRWRSADDHFPG